jgi:hypothetical protein
MQRVGLAAKQPLKCRCSISLHRGQHVRIRVEGDADRRVAQHLADDLGMHASKEKERCAGVPQVVEADLRHISSPECSLEVVIRHAAIVERVAARTGKDKVLVAPLRSEGDAFSKLPCPVCPQRPHRLCRQSNAPAAASRLGIFDALVPWTRWSVPRTCSVALSRITSLHRNPSNSPCRIPV